MINKSFKPLDSRIYSFYFEKVYTDPMVSTHVCLACLYLYSPALFNILTISDSSIKALSVIICSVVLSSMSLEVGIACMLSFLFIKLFYYS